MTASHIIIELVLVVGTFLIGRKVILDMVNGINQRNDF